MFAVCFIVCRVLSIGHTAKNFFAVCTHGKDIIHSKKYNLTCTFFVIRQNHSLSCFFLAHGKVMICRVFYFGTRKIIFFFSSQLKFFAILSCVLKVKKNYFEHALPCALDLAHSKVRFKFC